MTVKYKLKRKARQKPLVREPFDSDKIDNKPHHTSVLHYVGHPLHVLTDAIAVISPKVEKRRLRYVVGGLFMVAGSATAVYAGHMPIPHLGHVAVDLIAYAVHGCGAVPYITLVVRKLEME